LFNLPQIKKFGFLKVKTEVDIAFQLLGSL